ncbi:MAG TPA: hypothetical protein VHX59_26250 [Mycobacteriales bacterium]|jgi:hypothetical protein|nr:hypothetical protein [Mycobacteriales bacterium]
MQKPAVPLVILLTGTSLAGKSSLAGAMLLQITRPCLYLEADVVFPKLSPAYSAGVIDIDVHRKLPITLHRSLAAWPKAETSACLCSRNSI